MRVPGSSVIRAAKQQAGAGWQQARHASRPRPRRTIGNTRPALVVSGPRAKASESYEASMKIGALSTKTEFLAA